jgi:hypothetical protein
LLHLQGRWSSHVDFGWPSLLLPVGMYSNTNLRVSVSFTPNKHYVHLHLPHTTILSEAHTFNASLISWFASWSFIVESSSKLKAHGDAREGKWRGNWWLEWVASTLHTTSEHGVSSITATDAHTLAAGSRLNWCPHWFKWTSPFRRKVKSGFCACAITFRTQSTSHKWHPNCNGIQPIVLWCIIIGMYITVKHNKSVTMYHQ